MIKHNNVIYVYLFLQLGLHLTDGACTFPDDLQNGTWHSSDMGDVTFNSTHFTVSDIVDFGSLTFECISNTNLGYFSTSNPFDYLSISTTQFKVAICFKLEQLSSTSFVYFAQTSVLGNTDVNRVYFNQAAHAFSPAETCNSPSTDISHARLFVKEGYSSNASVDCANTISGNYMYQVDGTSCSNDTYVDGCSDKNELVFNYTLCSDVIAYSAGGQVSCMYNAESGNNSYTLLYNQDNTTDESTTYRFTCLVASGDANGTNVTTYPRACLEDQNVYTIASPGVSILLVANNTCETYIDDTTTTSTTTTVSSLSSSSTQTLSAGGAIAVVIAILVLMGATVVIGVWYYFRIHKKKKVNPDVIAAKSPPLDTKNRDREMDGRVSPFTPFPTVSEIALGRFGPSEIDDDDGGMTLEATTPGFTDGRRTMYGKDVERESQASLPMYSEVGGDTPEPTRLSEVHTRMSEISEVNIADPTPFTMTRATMNIPEETRVSPLQTPTENRPNGTVQSPRENGVTNDVTL